MYFSLTGLDSTIADNIPMRLKAGRQYLRMHFKIHTASESPSAGHYRSPLFALSGTATEYKGQCQHQRTISCDRCEDLKTAVSDLQVAVDSSEVHLRLKHIYDGKADCSIYNYPEQLRSHNFVGLCVVRSQINIKFI